MRVLFSFSSCLGIVPFLIIAVLFPFGSKNNATRYGITTVHGNNVARKFDISNQCGHRVAVHWMNPDTGDLVVQSESVFNGADFNLNSYIGHKFQFTELPGLKSGACGSGDGDTTCRINYFTVNDSHNQVARIDRAFDVEHIDDASIARAAASNLLNSCKQKQIDYIESTAKHAVLPDVAAKALEGLVACVNSKTANKLEEVSEELTFQERIRTEMGDALENYTCADDQSKDTEPTEKRDWTHKGRRHNVKVMLNRKRSMIHVIEKFINVEECAAIEKAAKPLLRKASQGEHRLYENWKDLQAGVKVPWHMESKGDPLTKLSRRILDYTNSVTGFELEEHGQEDLMSIQYIGLGESARAPIRPMPQCDGNCKGLPHKQGDRVATIMMYCEVAEKGGSTNFRNANVKLKVKKGSAVFFSYAGKDLITDNGFTEYSECPVISGETKIVTQWMRKGVDAENPWHSWNTFDEL